MTVLHRWTRAIYVDVEPQTMKAAIARAEADACSAVVSVTRETAEQRQYREFWLAVDERAARQALQQPRTLKLVSR